MTYNQSITARLAEHWECYAMNQPNPLHPDKMTIHERRAALGRILATGLLRLINANQARRSVKDGDRSLHFRPNQSGTAGPTQRRSA